MSGWPHNKESVQTLHTIAVNEDAAQCFSTMLGTHRWEIPIRHLKSTMANKSTSAVSTILP